MENYRRITLAAVALALGLALAGCMQESSDTSMPGMNHGTASATAPAAADPGQHNDADTMFATMMIPHHQQAVAMSDALLAKDGVDQRVRDLAQQIKDAQSPEIEELQSWLKAWGAPSAGTSGMGHGDGMMSESDMTALDAATGADAARLYLEQMVKHHEGAIQMAQDELKDGSHPDAVMLARNIVDTQAGEITTMQDLLAQI